MPLLRQLPDAAAATAPEYAAARVSLGICCWDAELGPTIWRLGWPELGLLLPPLLAVQSDAVRLRSKFHCCQRLFARHLRAQMPGPPPAGRRGWLHRQCRSMRVSLFPLLPLAAVLGTAARQDRRLSVQGYPGRPTAGLLAH